MAKVRIGDRLISAGLITNEQLEKALQEQKKQTRRKKIVRVLVDLGYLEETALLGFFVELCKRRELNLISILEDFPNSEENILKLLSRILNMEYVDLDAYEFNPDVADYIPFSIIEKYLAFPMSEEEGNIKVVLADPFDMQAKDAITRSVRGKKVIFCIAKKEQIVSIVIRLSLHDSVKMLVKKIREEMSGDGNNTLLADDNNQSSITKLIYVIFETAIKQKTSDIHIEGTEKSTLVRIRVDGIMREAFKFDKDMFAPLSSRIKLLANLDIAERRKPQDGRYSDIILDKPFDFRISTLPIITGESIVIRILDKSKVLVRLEDLGISELNYDRFNEAIKQPNGIVLVTGPTGSGKTTTLYAALNAIKSVTHKIITVEDPVEYQMDMIQQVMVNERAGMTFAAGLRSILRQDPDIIMIGEIRDKETLQIALQAALTGHLVLATLHTNDAISGVARLLDMGVESFFIGSTMCGLQAQRLVRKLCPHCRYEVEPPDKILSQIKNLIPDDYHFYKSHGCSQCGMQGYSGREVISEVVLGTEGMRRLISANATKDELLAEARKDGFVTMFEDALMKALEGRTSLDEVYRVAKLS
ncbi:GspE/PulE family protein [Helicobacter sp. MIT 14-3879]|uniref:GspE/PulE family protein n=1 Tax=Helicobacter sp. MIT 14-3879 TaxID=2040649 RepID=UPI000E1F3F4F|nr:GspE/PulE family protein [Helicobacter sp. MIT 14-3879]RDU65224.1 general secretion pathway protein GspE [Helicobacter sp. MIT 14-3879]